MESIEVLRRKTRSRSCNREIRLRTHDSKYAFTTTASFSLCL